MGDRNRGKVEIIEEEVIIVPVVLIIVKLYIALS